MVGCKIKGLRPKIKRISPNLPFGTQPPLIVQEEVKFSPWKNMGISTLWYHKVVSREQFCRLSFKAPSGNTKHSAVRKKKKGKATFPCKKATLEAFS